MSVDKLQWRSTGFAEGLIAETDLVVHDAGQAVLSTAASVEKRSWYDSGWRGPVAVAAFCLKIETVTHDRLPLCAVRPWLQSFFLRLPVDDQVGNFMGYGLRKIIIQIFTEEFQVDAQTSRSRPFNDSLASTTAAQGKIYRGFRQLDRIKIPRSPFGAADCCKGFFLKLCSAKVIVHTNNLILRERVCGHDTEGLSLRQALEL